MFNIVHNEIKTQLIPIATLIIYLIFVFISKSKMVQTSNPHHNHETLVLKSAIYSRILLLTLIIFFRTLVSPYDTSASLNPPCLTATATAANDTRRSPIVSAIENGIVWDSVYFVRSAECGYEYEQSYAFLPFLPLTISFLSPSTLFSFLPQRSLFAISAYVINNLAFVLAALYFYRYSLSLFH